LLSAVCKVFPDGGNRNVTHEHDHTCYVQKLCDFVCHGGDTLIENSPV
jgi:hypothetical protein